MHLVMPFGSPGSELVVLNIDSLWSGGPFENSVSFRPIPFHMHAHFETVIYRRKPNRREIKIPAWNTAMDLPKWNRQYVELNV